ncbi:hypothetical protein [Streptomyces macrosporus]
MDELTDAVGDVERPELGCHRRTYRPLHRKPSAYALLLLYMLPFAVLAFLLTVVLGAFLDWDGSDPAYTVGGLLLLGPFAVRAVWYRRHSRVEFRLYERGLVAITADGREAVYPWTSTTVFVNDSNHFKLCNAEGTVISLGPADRGPVLGSEKIKGLRTRTVIRGAQVPREGEWGQAIRQGVRDEQLAPAAAAALNGGGVTFGDLVLNQDGLTVRRKRGQDDFTTWEDVQSISLAGGFLWITSRSSDFPSPFTRPQYRIPNLEIFLDVSRRLHARRRRAAPVQASVPPRTSEPTRTNPAPDTPTTSSAPRDEERTSNESRLLGLYVTFGISAWAAWTLGARQEIDGQGSALLTVLAAVFGGFFGAVFGLGLAAGLAVIPRTVGAFVVEHMVRWFRHRRYLAASTLALCSVAPPMALLIVLFLAFPSRLVPLVVLLFFGCWILLLAMKWCGASERRLLRHLPDLPGVFLVAIAAEQIVSGDVLTLAPAAGAFFPLAVWLSWRGWRKMQESPRLMVRAAADIVLSVELGLVLTLFLVWLTNVLSFSPPEVAALRGMVEAVQGLTEVHWLYWLVAYVGLAAGSYAALRRPDRVARIRRRFRPARFSEARLPLGLGADFVRRSLTGINIGIMVGLLFLVVLVPVSEGTWKQPVAKRYALEVQRQQYAEGAAAAYKEIHRQVSTHPRSTAGVRAVIIAVQRAAPSSSGESVNRTALDIARQVGRFQAATLAPDDPADPQQPTRGPEAADLAGQVDELDERRQLAAERERQADRFAELAAIAITSTFELIDLGENQVVRLVKEYLVGLVEGGPVKKIFYRWGQRIGQPPPDGDDLVRIDIRHLTTVAYSRTLAAVQRVDADLLAFYRRFGGSLPTEDSSLIPAVDLANQHRYLRQGTGSCHGCVDSTHRGSSTSGGGGRR